MSAFDELKAGAPGDEFVRLLARTIKVVGQSRGFPPPEGHRAWSTDAVAEAASAFLTDSQTPRRLADLAVHCSDEAAVRARLQMAVINFLRDRGRRTELGRFIRRLRDVLAVIDGVIAVGEDHWRLAAEPDDPSTTSPWELESAANREPHVDAPSWGQDAKRNAPVADRETITRLAQRVLTAAAGSLTTADLARAMAPRLGLRSPPLTVALDRSAVPDPSIHDPADVATRRPRAEQILSRLTPRQRLAIAHYELTVRMLEPVLGVSRTQAALARSTAQDVLREELADDPDGDSIVLAVVDLAQKWAANRTTNAVPT